MTAQRDNREGCRHRSLRLGVGARRCPRLIEKTLSDGSIAFDDLLHLLIGVRSGEAAPQQAKIFRSPWGYDQIDVDARIEKDLPGRRGLLRAVHGAGDDRARRCAELEPEAREAFMHALAVFPQLAAKRLPWATRFRAARVEAMTEGVLEAVNM